MSDPIPVEWIDAVAEALHADNCPSDVDEGEPCDCGGWGREAEVAIAAVVPMVREQIAAELLREASRARNSPTGHHPDLTRWTDSATLKLAARIARGGAR